MIAQGAGVVQGVVRNVAIVGGAEAGQAEQGEGGRRELGTMSPEVVSSSMQNWAMSSGQSATISGSVSPAR